MGAVTIKEREHEFISEFSELSDRMLQYEYLLCYLDDINELPESARNDETKVKGCVSSAWMRVTEAGKDGLFIEFASDALIIKGVLGVISALTEGADREEISRWEPRFIEETDLKAQLSIDRQKGIASILQKLKSAASM